MEVPDVKAVMEGAGESNAWEEGCSKERKYIVWGDWTREAADEESCWGDV